MKIRPFKIKPSPSRTHFATRYCRMRNSQEKKQVAKLKAPTLLDTGREVQMAQVSTGEHRCAQVSPVPRGPIS